MARTYQDGLLIESYFPEGLPEVRLPYYIPDNLDATNMLGLAEALDVAPPIRGTKEAA
jgi:hypothetical protein